MIPPRREWSNLGPTNRMLTDRVDASVKSLQPTNPNTPIPADLVTTSASGLDPDITPAAAEFQIPRIARERGISEQDVRSLVGKHTLGRQFGFLGEAHVNVLDLNLELDARPCGATIRFLLSPSRGACHARQVRHMPAWHGCKRPGNMFVICAPRHVRQQGRVN